MDSTAIVLPVPAADLLVAPYRPGYDPSAQHGMPAHITLLYPFLPRDRVTSETQADLSGIASAEAPFTFALAELRSFRTEKDAALYLAPEPEEPFRRLIEAIARHWPENPPYGGIYDRVVPHLTIAMLELGAPEALIRSELKPLLPIQARAEEIWIMARTDGRWEKVGCTRLGSPGLFL